MCGIIGVPKKTFMIWNTVGALIWTQGIIGLGFILGDVLEGSVDKFLLPVIGIIIFASLVPVIFEVLREWQSKRFKK
jgi:membrane-associated protein